MNLLGTICHRLGLAPWATPVTSTSLSDPLCIVGSHTPTPVDRLPRRSMTGYLALSALMEICGPSCSSDGMVNGSPDGINPRDNLLPTDTHCASTETRPAVSSSQAHIFASSSLPEGTYVTLEFSNPFFNSTDRALPRSPRLFVYRQYEAPNGTWTTPSFQRSFPPYRDSLEGFIGLENRESHIRIVNLIDRSSADSLAGKKVRYLILPVLDSPFCSADRPASLTFQLPSRGATRDGPVIFEAERNFSASFMNPNDFDNDLVPNHRDNCPVDPNANQQDRDQDTIGDACDHSFYIREPHRIARQQYCQNTPNPRPPVFAEANEVNGRNRIRFGVGQTPITPALGGGYFIYTTYVNRFANASVFTPSSYFPRNTEELAMATRTETPLTDPLIDPTPPEHTSTFYEVRTGIYLHRVEDTGRGYRGMSIDETNCPSPPYPARLEVMHQNLADAAVPVDASADASVCSENQSPDLTRLDRGSFSLRLTLQERRDFPDAYWVRALSPTNACEEGLRNGVIIASSEWTGANRDTLEVILTIRNLLLNGVEAAINSCGPLYEISAVRPSCRPSRSNPPLIVDVAATR